MVLVPAGEFTMGENAGTHRVYLDAFWMDKYEVTAARYASFLQATGHKSPAYWNEVNLGRQSDRPVVGVDWHDAEAYCRWAGKRLPTEAEWEKAARGPTGYLYPWGNEEPSPVLANYDSDGQRVWKGYATLAPVGSYEGGQSPYGIYDMAGNVWEWVADWYDDGYYATSPDRNPKGPSSGWRKVVRGGSWYTIAPHVRSTYRLRHMPSHQTSLIGFRCSKDASQ
jgi:formylglycine-generating enzyme required for sulfatase activity